MSPRGELLIIGIAVLCFAGGWTVQGWRMEGQIEGLKSERQAEISRARQEAISQYQALQQRSQKVAARVAAEEEANNSKTEEKAREIVRVTTGRPCLGGAVVRVLNQPIGLDTKAATASAPGSTDAAFASDTDVALWIGQCQRAYDTCRGRIDAIREIDEQTEH